ncbi:type II toxin-antitoxin system CcdA family antitoxin [Marinobacter xiaoshiensis]|uniref:type II toxin-antitoxin system CcdA family antitoxin n=1 Tax=Marinobacter xiaoshiensis TaxID=3073652 RepID=UPI003F4945EB
MLLQLEATTADLCNIAAPKKAANLSVNSDLLNRARALNINLPAPLPEGAIQASHTVRYRSLWERGKGLPHLLSRLD